MQCCGCELSAKPVRSFTYKYASLLVILGTAGRFLLTLCATAPTQMDSAMASNVGGALLITVYPCNILMTGNKWCQLLWSRYCQTINPRPAFLWDDDDAYLHCCTYESREWGRYNIIHWGRPQTPFGHKSISEAEEVRNRKLRPTQVGNKMSDNFSREDEFNFWCLCWFVDQFLRVKNYNIMYNTVRIVSYVKIVAFFCRLA